MNSMLEIAAKVLGRSISVDEEASVSSLDEMPAALIAEARRLTEISLVLAAEFIDYYVQGTNQAQIVQFLDRVVLRNPPPTF